MPNHRILRLALPTCILVLLVLVTVSLVIGDMPLTLSQVWKGLLRQDELAGTVIWQMRMPRLLSAVLVGAALSAGGLVMQAYFRNSLASPGLLGVSSGGAAGAVIAIALGWSSFSIWTLPLAAIVGSAAALLAVIGLARSGASTERLLLAGVALNALLGSVTSYVLSMHTSLYERNSQILFWLLGGLEDRGWEHVLMASPIILAAALLWPLGRQMDLLSLGAREAQSLGVDVRRLRHSLLALAAVLTAIATAVAGTVGFVGLVVPHALRLLLGPEHRRLVPVSIVGGAAFVLGCDLVCRSAGGVKLGIITSLVGAPFFFMATATPGVNALEVLDATIPGRLEAVDLRLPGGCLAGLIGPNGAGKSTLLQICAGLLPSSASVTWSGRKLGSLSVLERGRLASWDPQEARFEFGFSVRSVVAQGRFAHGDDELGVDEAIEQFDLGMLRNRPVNQLSGGERQRVLLARALATGAPLHFWDEPLAPLDPRHALEILQLGRRMTQSGATLLFSLHDLRLAHCLDYVAVLHRGRLRAAGAPDEVLTPELLLEVFGVRARTAPGLVLEIP